MNTVAIVVPIYKEEFNDDEMISMRHLRHFLGKYDKYFIAPDNINIPIEYQDFFIKRFNRKYFFSNTNHNNLLISKEFYKNFDTYEYILIYHLDSLVFSDQLLQWCKKNYDYIGAPWFKTAVKQQINWKIERDIVGNGGFSLRKVQSCINVLNNCKHPLNLKLSLFSSLKRGYGLVKNYIKRGIIYNEDMFWGTDAKKIYPAFKVPTAEIAVSFAFEVGPRFCFAKNQHSLPFGCHAWNRYDREFWLPYLLKE